MSITFEETVDKAVEFYQKYPGHLKTAKADISTRLGVSEEAITEAKKVIRNKSRDAGEDVEQSYEEFLEEHGIEEDQVSLVWHKGKHFSVASKPEKDLFNPVEVFKEAISQYAPPSYLEIGLKSENKKKDRIAVINLYDAHLDKIALLSETDQKRTVQDNITLFEDAFNELLQSVKMKKPERIIIPFGNDFYHTNDQRYTTKKGTDLKEAVGMNPKDSFREGLNLLRRCIDKARSIANVFLVPVRGNHDQDRVDYLLEALLIAYEEQPDVGVLDNRKSRNYYRYGEWLFGFAHGDRERKADDLPNLMATDKDSRQHWSDISKGVYFLGDIHHEKKYKFMESKDFRGVEVKFLRSMGATDEWHWKNGYTGIPKTAYAFIFDKDGKRTQEFKVDI